MHTQYFLKYSFIKLKDISGVFEKTFERRILTGAIPFQDPKFVPTNNKKVKKTLLGIIGKIKSYRGNQVFWFFRGQNYCKWNI